MTEDHARHVLSRPYEDAAWGEYRRAAAAGEHEFANDLLAFLGRQVQRARLVLAYELWENPPPPRGYGQRKA